jgi:PPM family protein phosphatase
MQAEVIIKEKSNYDISSIFRGVHEKLKEVAAKDENLQNMATTFTLCLIKGKTVLVGHVGDSRLYLLRDSSVAFKTEDQTLYNDLSNKGVGSAHSYLKNKYSNILSSALCPTHQYELSSTEFTLSSGDRLIICSDGIHKVISDKELVEISAGSANIQSLILKIKAVLRIRGMIDDSSIICVGFK